VTLSQVALKQGLHRSIETGILVARQESDDLSILRDRHPPFLRNSVPGSDRLLGFTRLNGLSKPSRMKCDFTHQSRPA
jgi:hypothetical protein